MGNIMTAFLNKTLLVIIASQQTRQMLVGDRSLTDRDAATTLGERGMRAWIRGGCCTGVSKSYFNCYNAAC